jgi:hypothetical protein
MISILIFLLAFGATTIQLIRSNLAKSGEPNIGGLERTAAIILLLSSAGLILGIVKEIQTAKGAREDAKNLKEMEFLVKTTVAKLDGISARLPGGAVKEELRGVRDQLSAPGSHARASNLRNSDFSLSWFQYGNFTASDFQGSLFEDCLFRNAVFKKSVFDGADFRGADLSRAIFDDATLLPSHK